MTEDFIKVLEAFLGVKRTSISIADEWRKNPPKDAKGMQLKAYLKDNVFAPLCHDYYKE
ncbi:hypothetical protein BT63DRAFT_420558 [Microthyrium microscopicum]|uniref:Uncharacterized protein n=1 Tax=Microthyrium microscopicum TaxID=703497 RepID=A0A6A6UU61_9PEZI|nr:hypothetical protein BT63DRAFT_420558 [Microthyrium microscopicum]